MNRFRPQDLPKTFVMKERLRFGNTINYSWQTRIEWYPVGWKQNQKQISKRFTKLHYLACHAPEPIQKQWKKAYTLFMNKHFAERGNASMRYLNKNTCHAWL